MSQQEPDLARLAFIVKYYAERAKALDAIVRQGVADLQRSASVMSAQGSSLKSEVVNGVRSETRTVVGQEAKQAVEPLRQISHAFSQDAGKAANVMEAAAADMQRQVRSWKVLGLGGLVLGMTVATLSFLYAWWATHDAVERNRIQVEKQIVVNKSDMLMDDNRLYANVDMEAEPIGDQKQYYPVKQRP